MRTRPILARGLALTLIASALGCSSVTTVTATDPIAITAKPPALPLPDLPPIPQPPPPPRVTVEGELLVLDEALGFDEAGKLAAEHADIVTELAVWLARNEDVSELSIEVSAAGESSRRKQDKRNKALANALVAALVAEGIDSARLLPVSAGKSDDGQVHVVLRVSKRGEAEAGFTLEE